MSYKVAVVGATGNVGREILSILEERNFPASEVVAVASRNSKGKKVSFGEHKTLVTQVLDDYDFTGTHIALFSPGGAISAIHAPRAAAAGCIVIDNTSHFRMDADVPLVIPEVNPHAIAEYTKRNIIANPNCSTIQMLVALKPLHDVARIKRIVVSTYQSVSGAGKDAMDELYSQTKAFYMNSKLQPAKFSRQIAFNVIPQIDSFADEGYTKEELKIVN
jgi:aspartate-semialdehyde dehydrogenase